MLRYQYQDISSSLQLSPSWVATSFRTDIAQFPAIPKSQLGILRAVSSYLLEEMIMGLRKGENGVAWGLWVGKSRD